MCHIYIMPKFKAIKPAPVNKKVQIISWIAFFALILLAIVVPIKEKSPNDIFVLTPVESLEFGHTTLSGTIRKDSPVGKDGIYFLILPDSRSIMLNMSGYDEYIGQKVKITGYLTPGIEDNESPLMLVETLTKE